MKCSALSVLGFCMLSSMAFGAGGENLASIERQWAQAMVHRDKAYLEAIMAPEFSFIDAAGHMLTKKQFVGALVSGAMGFESAKVSHLNVRIYGSAAVVTGLFHAKGQAGKEALTGTYPFTDTFIRQNGRWVAIAGHTSRLPK